MKRKFQLFALFSSLLLFLLVSLSCNKSTFTVTFYYYSSDPENDCYTELNVQDVPKGGTMHFDSIVLSESTKANGVTSWYYAINTSASSINEKLTPSTISKYSKLSEFIPGPTSSDTESSTLNDDQYNTGLKNYTNVVSDLNLIAVYDQEINVNIKYWRAVGAGEISTSTLNDGYLMDTYTISDLRKNSTFDTAVITSSAKAKEILNNEISCYANETDKTSSTTTKINSVSYAILRNGLDESVIDDVTKCTRKYVRGRGKSASSQEGAQNVDENLSKNEVDANGDYLYYFEEFVPSSDLLAADNLDIYIIYNDEVTVSILEWMQGASGSSGTSYRYQIRDKRDDGVALSKSRTLSFGIGGTMPVSYQPTVNKIKEILDKDENDKYLPNNNIPGVLRWYYISKTEFEETSYIDQEGNSTPYENFILHNNISRPRLYLPFTFGSTTISRKEITKKDGTLYLESEFYIVPVYVESVNVYFWYWDGHRQSDGEWWNDNSIGVEDYVYDGGPYYVTLKAEDCYKFPSDMLPSNADTYAEAESIDDYKRVNVWDNKSASTGAFTYNIDKDPSDTTGKKRIEKLHWAQALYDSSYLKPDCVSKCVLTDSEDENFVPLIKPLDVTATTANSSGWSVSGNLLVVPTTTGKYADTGVEEYGCYMYAIAENDSGVDDSKTVTYTFVNEYGDVEDLETTIVCGKQAPEPDSGHGIGDIVNFDSKRYKLVCYAEASTGATTYSMTLSTMVEADPTCTDGGYKPSTDTSKITGYTYKRLIDHGSSSSSESDKPYNDNFTGGEHYFAFYKQLT